MPHQTTDTNARDNFAKLCDQVTQDREVVVISRRGAEDVALVAAAELSGLLETAHGVHHSNSPAVHCRPSPCGSIDCRIDAHRPGHKGGYRNGCDAPPPTC